MQIALVPIKMLCSDECVYTSTQVGVVGGRGGGVCSSVQLHVDKNSSLAYWCGRKVLCSACQMAGG